MKKGVKCLEKQIKKLLYQLRKRRNKIKTLRTTLHYVKICSLSAVFNCWERVLYQQKLHYNS